MANYDIGTYVGHLRVIDKRSPSNADNATATATITASGKISTLRAALTTADSGYYTSAQLDKMTRTDMEYALRLINDAAGF